jgi:hypothetical protein
VGRHAGHVAHGKGGNSSVIRKRVRASGGKIPYCCRAAAERSQYPSDSEGVLFAYCLADFFNLQFWPSGRAPVFPDVRDGLDDLVTAAVAALPGASEVTFRLYGGWEGDVPYTRAGLRSMTDRAISNMVKRVGRTRLRVELAETPIWDRSLRMQRTVRVARLGNVRASVESCSRCVDPTHCSVRGLECWLTGRCPATGCSVRLSEVAWTYQQKMVDALLTVDAAVIACDSLADAVLVASDDEDMLPALLALSRTQLSVVHLVRNGPPPPYYEGILELAGVQIRRW